jgi:hypothetical protein
MKKVFFIIIALFSFQNLIAQYTEIINSKRPGFSESPYGVGTNVYQFETGLYYINSNNTAPNSYPNTFGGELFFRIGKFIERLEVNVNLAYQGNEVLNPLGENYNISGLSDMRIGAKYLIYQQEFTDKSKEIRSWKKRTAFDKKRLIPSVGVYVGVLPNFLSSEYKNEGIGLKGAVLLQNDINDRLVVLSNLIVDEIMTDNMFYAYIVTMTYAINQNWSFFVENVGKFQPDYAPEFQFGTGIAYLFSPNLQVDASIRTNFFDDYSYLYASTGFSYRIDRHQDQLIYTNSKPTKTKTKKGFFSRLFGKN